MPTGQQFKVLDLQLVEFPHIWVSRVSPSKADDTTARLPAYQAIEAAQKAVDNTTGVPKKEKQAQTKTKKKKHNALQKKI